MRKHTLLRRARSRGGGTALVSLLAVLLTALGFVGAPPASAAVTWNDGPARYSTVVNCPSIIWGNPYTERGIGAYAGHAVDADSDRPKVGEIFYIHVEIFGLGNPCAGPLVQPTFNLPAGASFAREAPIQCYVNGGGGNAPNTNCPGWDHLDANGVYRNRNQGEYPGVWPIPQGVEFEIRVPVKASQPMSGTNWSVSLWTADGNDSPTLQLPATMWVFPNAPEPQPDPQISYPNPSTTASAQTPNGQPTKYGLYSQFTVSGLAGAGGTQSFRIGTSATSLTTQGSVNVANGNASSTAWTDWDEPGFGLQAGQTYYWRGVFDPGAAGGGDAVVGPVQSFTVPGGGGGDPDPDPGPEPEVKADPKLDAWPARATVARTKPAVLKATLAAGATGKVTFTSGGKRLCVATISDGKATCSASARLKPGIYKVRASYPGDAKFLADGDTFRFTKKR